MNNYLVPMWSYKIDQIKRRLIPIKAINKYQAMLIAINLYENKTDKSDESLYIDRDYENYSIYKECEDPQHIFTCMDNHVKIDSNYKAEDTYMDIYDYMYWGDYNARIKELAEKALPEK